MKNQSSIAPLRMIRVVKNLSMEEVANFFQVTKAYISAVESNQRKFRIQTLKFGLDKMDISVDDYSELEIFSQELLNRELSDRDKYKFMLMKTFGIVEPETRVQIEELLESIYPKKK